ncbi:TetR/AcrR family transcriptional regulator [Flexithrix dorotheae]|uniref:TetR/AcrR family transcriptional regulator n=1 Tax=Flexithrix dorotheae TaxID=70993 RepID=UPI0003A6839F|nr:TetR/AcrR family transcriptional regulator [Flexithrix dorotheae]
MKTKEKILSTAKSLFNEKGVDATSVRQIAREMEISHGNLRYHYPEKEGIVQALFKQCMEESEKAVGELLSEDVDLESVIKASWIQAQKFWEYRFLMKNLSRIVEEFPSVKTALHEMYGQRKKDFFKIFQMLTLNDWMKPEPFAGYYVKIIENFLLIVDYGIPFIEVNYQTSSEEVKIKKYFQAWFTPIIPLITEKGKEVLEQHKIIE